MVVLRALSVALEGWEFWPSWGPRAAGLAWLSWHYRVLTAGFYCSLLFLFPYSSSLASCSHAYTSLVRSQVEEANVCSSPRNMAYLTERIPPVRTNGSTSPVRTDVGQGIRLDWQGRPFLTAPLKNRHLSLEYEISSPALR